MRLRSAGESEFDAFAHGVDAFRAHADLIAEVPFELAGFCAAASARAARSAAASTWQGNDGVIALAKHASRPGEFRQRPDGQQTFHKNFKDFNKTTVFLYG